MGQTFSRGGIRAFSFSIFALFLLRTDLPLMAQTDPGPRTGSPAAGTAMKNMTASESAAFYAGKSAFEEIDSVSGTLSEGSGLGPRFNLDSCAGCHAFPASGGSAPAHNPQVDVAVKAGAKNKIPSFLDAAGPVKIARFKKGPSGEADGGVHDLFVITGRDDAAGCTIAQPDFEGAVASKNIAFRIPTPLFGSGLIEAIDDKTILDNQLANAALKAALGISGRVNRSGNDGSLTRFGWKAQNKSLFVFAGEAYNVEQGVTNDVFPQERESAAGCRFNATPEDHFDVNSHKPDQAAGDVVLFTMFMRMLAPPARGPLSDASTRGESLFQSIGCVLCHTPSMSTASNSTGALASQQANLYSDLLLHKMGAGLADDIAQGYAAGDEFRTAPLWGLGQRLFFLHDGRAADLMAAITAHASKGSEANGVAANYNALTSSQKQDLLVFLRSL